MARPRNPLLRVIDALALVPALAAAWSAFLLAPLADLPASAAAVVAGGLIFALGLAILRLAEPRAAGFALPALPLPADEDALLLDQPLTARIDALAELVLDDPLPPLPADSRVVRLFPAHAEASPAALKARIDAHLGKGQAERPQARVDASDSLRRALDELRSSLAGR